jgi:hypothetical protein
MTQLKKHIAYTFLAVFVCTAIIGILGAIGIFPIPVTPLVSIFVFLVTQCITVIAAIIKAPNYFEDPPAVTKLKEQHEQAIQQVTVRERDAASKRYHDDQETIARLQSQITQLTDLSKAASVTYLNEKRKWEGEMQRLRAQIPQKPIPPLAPGSARTRTAGM